MHALRRDFAYAFRLLLRSPAFTAISVLCLALGIGATTAVFTIVDAVAFRPLPYPGSERLVRVYTEFTQFPGGGLRRFPVSPPEYAEMRAGLRSFEHLDAWSVAGVNLGSGNEPTRITATLVTGSLFQTLGVKPALGRTIAMPDDSEGAPLTVVLSDGLWRRSFGGDPRAIGREVRINGTPATVIGVMKPGFEFPPGQADVSEAWIPQQLTQADMKRRGNHRLNIIARLRQDTTLEQARAEIDSQVAAWGHRRSEAFHTIDPGTHPVVAYSMHDEVVRAVRPAMLVVLLAVGFVLLIASVNVANLLLARAEARQKEISIRLAIGAGAGGLVRQFLAEGLLISAAGTVAGALVAVAGVRILLWAGAGAIPRASEVALDWRVAAFAVLLLAGTAVLFGVAPLAQALARNAHEGLKSASGRTSATRGASLVRRALVVSELAVALILLVATALMVQAFWKLQSVDVGFRPERVLSLRVSLPAAQYTEPARALSFFTQLEEALRRTPGLESATLASGLPPQRGLNANDTQIQNFVPRPGGPLQNVDYWQFVGDRFAETLGARLVDGRTLDARDAQGAAPSAMVNETMARTFWPGESAIGKKLRPSKDAPWFTVVGVLADIKNAGPDRPTGTELFLPYRQVPIQGFSQAMVFARTASDPAAAAAGIRRVVRELEPAAAISAVRTMEDVIAQSNSRPRFLSVLLTFFTVVALALAGIGVYGVISYSVARRTSEFGVRMAVGADVRAILRLVLRQGLVLGATGVAAGLLGAAMLVRFLRALLFGVQPFDPATFAGTSALLLGITAIASFMPARRATQVDPVVALRYE